jgi:hypothetical protein
MRHRLIIPDETRTRLAGYPASLQAGTASAGKRLQNNLAGTELATLTEAGFLDALLNTKPPQIFAEVTLADGTFHREGYYGLYARRLLPVFHHVNATAFSQGKEALLTIPGLGCGQFAGPFAGRLGAGLQTALERFLTRHGASFPHLKAVYYDPYGEGSNRRQEIHGISLMVRPLIQGNTGKSQLCPPPAYAEGGDDFSGCVLFSIVAWDHVSWPGNDYFGGSRCTDDDVKAAATDSMAVLTGFEGRYDPHRAAYLPPAPYRTWDEVVGQNGLRLESADHPLTFNSP